MGETTKESSDSEFESTSTSSEIVHSELSGTLPSSIHGNKYFWTFIDQFSLYKHAIGIKKKGHAVDVTENYKSLSHIDTSFKNGFE